MATLDSTGHKLEISCGSCGQKNRVPVSRLDAGPVCGACKSKLELDGPVTVTDRSFDGLLGSAAVPVVVDFWADWCGPCRMLAPELEQVARQAGNAVIVAKLDTERDRRTAARFGVRSIPLLIKFEAGQEARRLVGAQPAHAIRAQLGL